MSEEPDQISEPHDALPEISMDRLPEDLKQGCRRVGWDKLLPVQSKAIPYLLEGRDLMVQSRTGSGKTGAFVLPMLDLVEAERATTQALVLVPTRELAGQVSAEAERLTGENGLRVTSIYGGVGYGKQLKALKEGSHLVVGTPGRILDHLLKRTLILDDLKILVFDEADRMLSMGFYEDMLELKKFLPRRKIRSYMFSATYPHVVLRMAGQFLKNPDILSLSQDHVHVTDTEHAFIKVPAMERDRYLIRLIEVENPHSCIIFCNTKDNVRFLSTVLQRFGYNAEELSADLSQRAREGVMARLRTGHLRFLVATDLASRGIDIPQLSHVIQYEPPEDPENYIHRAGRTGRRGATGVAITLVTLNDERHLKAVKNQYKMEMVERPAPTSEEVEKIVSERVMVRLETEWRRRDNLQKERQERFEPLARMLNEHDDGARIIAMLLDNFYLQTHHAQPVPEEEKKSKPAPARKTKPRQGGRPQRGRGRGR